MILGGSDTIFIGLAVNLIVSVLVLPRVNTGFLAEPRFGETSLSAVSGVWSVVTAMATASLVLALSLRSRLPDLRKTLDAGLVGFGAVQHSPWSATDPWRFSVGRSRRLP